MLKIIPFGERILVRRKKVGETIGKEGLIVAPDEIKERSTDLADVVYVPDLTFGDVAILDNAESIVKSLTEKSINGDSDALIALLRLNEFIKMKSLKVGDSVIISKYVGIDIGGKDTPEEQITIVNENDIIGLIMKNE